MSLALHNAPDGHARTITDGLPSPGVALQPAVADAQPLHGDGGGVGGPSHYGRPLLWVMVAKSLGMPGSILTHGRR